MYNSKSKGFGKMRRALFVFFVPLVSFAICENCDAFRSSLLTRNQDITAQVQSMQTDFSYILVNANNLRISLENEDSAYAYDAGNLYTQAEIGQAKCSIALEMLASNRVDILSFNCDCDSSGGCECAGVLTNIYESLQYIEVYSRETSYGMETLLHDLETFKTAVVDGFLTVSNQLDDVISSIDSVVTNRYRFTFLNINYLMQEFAKIDRSGNISTVLGRYFSPYQYSYSVIDGLSSINAYLIPSVFSIDNFLYDFSFRRFPVITNTVGTLTRESTNFFSFFRGEIGVHGVLEDWTEQDGSYYDFLTNHYIQAVTGGTLSGNQSSKTNWFARVETLLASLVFADAATTNTVDASDNQELKEQISSSFHELTEGPQNGMIQTLDDVTPNVISQVRRFSSVFSSASMPSNVTLYSSDGENGFNIAFDISGDSVYYDLFRNVTTLCWALIGLFVVYRFLVWSITQIVNLVYFCFNVFTDIFKSR